VSGLLDNEALEKVFNAWRRVLRLDPLLSRVAMPDLRLFAEAFNLALTGDDDNDTLTSTCDELVQNQLEASVVIRITAILAETFTDEAGTTSGAVTKSLVGTLGHVCGLLTVTMVANMRELARRDALTGLENRLAWNEDLLGDLNSSAEVAVAIIDLDDLKQINDGQGGHDEGDRYLKKFASDLVLALPEGATAYRFGGDEYAVRWPTEGGEPLRQSLDVLGATDGVALFSYGVGRASLDSRDPERLTKIADERMYEMKNAHKVASIDGDREGRPTTADATTEGRAAEALLEFGNGR
jgi:diguanylate cyclase (GGDEF)-like protein